MDTALPNDGRFVGPTLIYAATALAIFLVATSYIPQLAHRYTTLSSAPVVGAAFSFEPGLITRYRFPLSGWKIVQDGWQKSKTKAFTIIRPESNITVIPRRYVDELANIPDSRLAASESIVNDMMREYTRADILLGGHLGHKAVKAKLTPQLAMLTKIIEEELDVAANEDPLHVTKEWSEQNLGQHVSKLIGRVTSRLFVSLPLCRDPEWLKLNLDLVRAIFETTVILRNMPRWMHPMLGAILPSRRRLKQCFKNIHAVLVPLVENRREQERIQGDAYQKPADVMQWMMDLANEEEAEAENLATRFAYTILGSMQTVVELILNCTYELCVRPEYVEPLREEIEHALKEGGGWSKSTAAKMVKTDSFMKEVFRHYAPSALAFRRITKEPIVLSDGLVLPKDTYVCVATTSPAQDAMEDSDQDRFDGFRYYKKREGGGPASRWDFATTDKSHISFGHGRYACPGRFAASIETKMLLAYILLRYDVKVMDGKQDRPRSMHVLEFGFLDPEATIMMRLRS